MYPAHTQLLAKWSSPSIGDRRATGCIWKYDDHHSPWWGLESPCQWLRGERNFALLQSKSLDDILNVTKILMNGTIRHCQMKRWWPVEWMVLDWETLILGSNNVKSLRRNNGGSRLIWSLCFQVFVVVVFIDPVALRHLYQNCRSKTSVMVNIELKLVHNNVGVGNTWVF